jgi:hypothetical protein
VPHTEPLGVLEPPAPADCEGLTLPPALLLPEPLAAALWLLAT